ncbi:hypothetical protein AM501_05265 [Aneurinibacillus migulanus]|uniref:hypothetical protein n=1 Tax=Aneurinibacillus migulanus TaxID=47500 RepID=UPI0005B8BEAE|nr:hypothetical protein [Aneurinibacillus migulanus]KIV58582.1 hypothetical protein TS64_04350 [Aneurinibacillus migulanus]KPD09246.1 hypothetical protein AM501_05265 [Aneurinibacillus migulanus]
MVQKKKDFLMQGYTSIGEVGGREWLGKINNGEMDYFILDEEGAALWSSPITIDLPSIRALNKLSSTLFEVQIPDLYMRPHADTSRKMEIWMETSNGYFEQLLLEYTEGILVKSFLEKGSFYMKVKNEEDAWGYLKNLVIGEEYLFDEPEQLSSFDRKSSREIRSFLDRWLEPCRKVIKAYAEEKKSGVQKYKKLSRW